jgi:hypothetical protein
MQEHAVPICGKAQSNPRWLHVSRVPRRRGRNRTGPSLGGQRARGRSPPARLCGLPLPCRDPQGRDEPLSSRCTDDDVGRTASTRRDHGKRRVAHHRLWCLRWAWMSAPWPGGRSEPEPLVERSRRSRSCTGRWSCHRFRRTRRMGGRLTRTASGGPVATRSKRERSWPQRAPRLACNPQWHGEQTNAEEAGWCGAPGFRWPVAGWLDLQLVLSAPRGEPESVQSDRGSRATC